MVWWHAPAPDELQEAYQRFRRPRLGRAVEPVWSVFALHRPAEFNKSHVPAFLADEEPRGYVCVYPFVRSYEWDLLPERDRRPLAVGERKKAPSYPAARARTPTAVALGSNPCRLAVQARGQPSDATL